MHVHILTCVYEIHGSLIPITKYYLDRKKVSSLNINT